MPRSKTRYYTVCCKFPTKDGGVELFVPVKGHTFLHYNRPLDERGYVIVGRVVSEVTNDYEADVAKAVDVAKAEFNGLFKIAQLIRQVIAGEIAYRCYDSLTGIVDYDLVFCKIVEDEATKHLIVNGRANTEWMAVISQLTGTRFFSIRGNWVTGGIMLPNNKVIPFGQLP